MGINKRTIILERPKNELLPEDLDDTSIIGVEGPNGERGHVLKISGEAYALVVPGSNNYKQRVFCSSIKELLRERTVTAAHVFDTPQELIIWMSGVPVTIHHMQGDEDINGMSWD